MAVSKPEEQAPGAQEPEDGPALLVAALNQAWAQYDAEVNRGFQVVNYYIVATAVVATAYVSAINGKHHLLAAALALSEMVLTTVTFLMWLRQRQAAYPSALALRELQGRVDTKLTMESVRVARTQPRTGPTRLIAPVTLGLALAGGLSALIYAAVQ
jgi:hypothetical protein